MGLEPRDPLQRAVYAALNAPTPLSLEQLAERTRLPSATVYDLLVALEHRDLVVRTGIGPFVNEAENPSAESSLNGLSANGNTAVSRDNTVEAFHGDYAVKVTNTIANNDGIIFYVLNANGNQVPAVPGELFTIVAHVRAPAGTFFTTALREGLAAATLLRETPGPNVAMTGGWERVSMTQRTGSQTAGVRGKAYVRSPSPLPVTDVWMDGFVIARGAYTGPYFEGAGEPWMWRRR